MSHVQSWSRAGLCTPSGWDCWLLSADTRLPKLIGLKPKRKIPLFNGNLECRLYLFPVVAGGFRERAPNAESN